MSHRKELREGDMEEWREYSVCRGGDFKSLRSVLLTYCVTVYRK